MSQGVIIIKKANAEVPKDFLELALQSCPKVWGAAFVDKGVLEIMHGENPVAEDLLKTLDEFKDIGITLYLGDSTSATNLKGVPPFPLIETDDEEPLVAIIPEGNFPGYAKEKSTFPPAYHLAEHLFDDFNASFDMVDKNLDKFMGGIEKDSFKKKMNLASVSRGYITVIARNNQVITFSQGETAKDFDWGWCSNTFGYGAEKKEEPKAEPEKKGGMFSRRSTVREKHVDHQPSGNVTGNGADKSPPTETAIKAPESGTPKPPPKEPKKLVVIEDITIKKMKIPPMNRKNRANWIKEKIGYKPNTIDDVNAEYEVYTKPDGTVLSRDEINRLFGLSAAKLFDEKKLTNAPPLGAQTENQNIDSSKEVIQPMPILSGSARERSKRFISDERILKLISENSEVITDPDNVQNTETKIPPHWQQLGEKDSSQWDALPFLEIEKYGRADIHALAVLAYSWKMRALKAEHSIKSKIKDGMKDQLKPVEAEAEPPKKARGMFSRAG